MRITGIKAYRVGLPLHEGSYKWSGGNSVDVFDSTIVAIATDAGTSAGGVGREIRRSEWAHLSISGDAGVRRDGHDGRIEDIDGVATRPLVATLMQGQSHTVGLDSGDPHACSVECQCD